VNVNSVSTAGTDVVVAVWLVLQFLGWRCECSSRWGADGASSNLRNEWAAACKSWESR